MLILKFNTLSAQDLFAIERRLFRWLDAQGTCGISDDFNVLDYGRTDLYGHLLGIFAKLDIFKAIGTTPSQMLDFFIDVDTTYLNAPYHSFYHAVDIVTVLYYILTELAADHYLSDMDVASLMIAALCHDAGHPGYNNLYQVNFKTDLANRYGNTSTLEAYSVDITRNLLKKHGLLKNLGSATEERILATIENLILSTDMVYHYELQEQLGSLEDSLANDDASDWYDAYDADISDTDSLYFSSADDDSSISTSNATITTTTTSLSSSPSSITGAEVCEDDTTLLLNQEQRRSFCRVLLHAADISNTVRPWSISKQWSDLIVQEFFQQGDAEKQAGLEISPGMDRDQSTQPNISLKFGDFVVKPYFEALAAVLPAAHSFLTKLAENRCEWERLKNCPEAASPPPPAHERQFPASLLPAQPVLNPAGRRVSVAAGMVVIPDQRISRRSKQRSTKIRRQLGSRSASHSGLPRISLPDNTINENVSFAHRRQSEHTYSLYGASYCISPTLLRPVIFDSSSSNSLTVYEQDKYVHPRRSQPRVA